MALIWRGARLRGVDPVRAAALFGLNPLIVMYGVGGGHNDLLMLFVVVAGVVATLEFRERTGAGLIVLGAAVKLTGALLLPFAIARSWAQNEGRRRFDSLTGAAARDRRRSGILVRTVRHRNPAAALDDPDRAERGRLAQHPRLHLDPARARRARPCRPGSCSRSSSLCVLCVLVRRVAIGRLDWIDGAAWATVAMLVTASSLLPWYIAWLIPLVGAQPRTAALRSVAIGMTGVMLRIKLLGYIPHGATVAG